MIFSAHPAVMTLSSFCCIPTYIPHREKICQNVATNDIDVLRVTSLQRNKTLQNGI